MPGMAREQYLEWRREQRTRVLFPRSTPAEDRVRLRRERVTVELLESLAKGGSCLARVLVEDDAGDLQLPGSTVFNVTIHDHLGMFLGEPGMRALAEWWPLRGADGEWGIYQMQCAQS